MRFGLVGSTQSRLPGVGQWRRRVLGEQANKLEVDYGAEGRRRSAEQERVQEFEANASSQREPTP